MRFRLLLTALGVLALAAPLANCHDQAIGPDQADVEIRALYDRLLDVKARADATGELTGADLEELDRVSEDILAWQKRYDRYDITIEEGVRTLEGPPNPAVPLAAAQAPGLEPPGDGGTDCTCEDVTFINGQICYLVRVQDCQLGSWTCVYRCYRIWTKF